MKKLISITSTIIAGQIDTSPVRFGIESCKGSELPLTPLPPRDFRCE